MREKKEDYKFEAILEYIDRKILNFQYKPKYLFVPWFLIAINQHRANIILLNESKWNSKCWASSKSRKIWNHLLWPGRTPKKTIVIFCSLIFLLVKIHQFSLFYCEPFGEILETRIICGPLVFIYIKKYKPGFGEVLLFFTITRLCLFKHVRNMIAKNLRIGRNMSYGK